MQKTIIIAAVAAALVVGGYFLYMPAPEKQVDTTMSFFITSTNPGRGGDLGGLSGADAHCTALAEAAGVAGKTWAAYLSTTGDGSVNARDRIGTGPWYNAKGVRIAGSIDELHNSNMLTKETALTEKGEIVFGRGDTPNMHDMLTGSTEFGTASTTATGDTTCANWTSGADGSAIVGHHDRIGINDSAPMKSWVSSHGSRGCSLEALQGTGGNGLFYCFAK